MVMLGAVSCKNIELNGAPDDWYLDMKVVSLGSTEAYISIKYPDDVSPKVDKLKIFSRDGNKIMPYAVEKSTNPLTVKLLGLTPSKSYTIYAILPESGGGRGGGDNMAVISKNDVSFKTTSR